MNNTATYEVGQKVTVAAKAHIHASHRNAVGSIQWTGAAERGSSVRVYHVRMDDGSLLTLGESEVSPLSAKAAKTEAQVQALMAQYGISHDHAEAVLAKLVMDELVAAGMELPAAWDVVLGAGSYQRISDSIFDQAAQ